MSTVVSENQQSRDMADMAHNVNTIVHPVDAASRANLKISPKIS